jgi:hypothetical protein
MTRIQWRYNPAIRPQIWNVLLGCVTCVGAELKVKSQVESRVKPQVVRAFKESSDSSTSRVEVV